MQYTQLSRRSALVKSSDIDWEKQYLTFIPVVDTTFNWAQRATSGTLEYSTNDGQTWVTIANGESTPTITAGSKVIWRGNLKPNTTSNNGGVGTFSASGNYNAYGNTMSLLFYDNYYNSQLNSEYNYAFSYLFQNDTHILDAPELPATTLSKRCYTRMFYGCSSLNYIKALFTTTPSSDYTDQWVEDVASTGTFVKNRKATWTTTGVNGIPTGWTVVDDNS